MSFLASGLTEFRNYGNLSLRATKSATLAAFVVLIPLIFVIAVASQLVALSNTELAPTISGVIRLCFVALILPLLLALVIRRVNDQFPGSVWTQVFTRIPDGTFRYAITITGLWMLLLAIGSALLFFAWPIYLLLLLGVLILPSRAQAQPLTFTNIPAPPSVKSSLPPLPVMPQTSSALAGEQNGQEIPFYKQGIFWFAVAVAVFICLGTFIPSLNKQPEHNLPVVTNSETPTAPSSEPAPTVTRTVPQTATATPSSIPAEGVTEQSETSALDPRFNTCGEANAAGYGPYVSGVNPEYDWYIDRDKDGIDCER